MDAPDEINQIPSALILSLWLVSVMFGIAGLLLQDSPSDATLLLVAVYTTAVPGIFASREPLARFASAQYVALGIDPQLFPRLGVVPLLVGGATIIAWGSVQLVPATALAAFIATQSLTVSLILRRALREVER